MRGRRRPTRQLDPHYYRTKSYRPCKSDSQRHKVYEMERGIIGQALWTETDIVTLENITRHACRKWHVPVPDINIVSTGDHVFGYADHAIYLNKNFHGANISTLLHELAHWIHGEQKDYEPDQESHGPEWVSIYISLMDTYRVMPRIAMEAMCDVHRIRRN